MRIFRLAVPSVLLTALLLFASGLVPGPADTTLPDAESEVVESPIAMPPEEPAKGPDQERWFFSEWHHPYGNVLPREVLDGIWDEVETIPAEDMVGPRAINSWDCLGPWGMDVPSTGAKYTGRVLDIEVPSGAATRIASASGALWSFLWFIPYPMTDGLTSQAIGSFATDPLDSDHIFVGTGEPFIRAGTGLWETTDAGGSWTHVALPVEPTSFFRIRYDPTNTNIIHACTGHGYFRSTDNGGSWNRILTGWVSDISVSPTASNVIYMGRYGAGVAKSTDSGASWTLLVDGSGTLPTTDLGRIAVSVSGTTSQVVYAAIVDVTDHNTHGVYRSSNGGSTWSDVTPPSAYHWGQGWYNNVIGASPTDHNIVLAGGGSLWRTTDGGTNWAEVADSDVHVDHHAIRWHSDGTRVWEGNDGGWIYSDDAGATWSSSSNFLPITQYVHIDAALSDARIIGGGTQDNGIPMTTDGGSSWTFASGGDGSAISVHPSNPDKIWMTNGVYGGDWSFRRLFSTDRGVNWSHINTGIDPSGMWWPMILHDSYAGTPWIYTNSDTWVYRSTDEGSNWAKHNAAAFPANVSNISVAKWSGSTNIYACLASSTAGQRLQVYDGAWVERSAGLPAGERVRHVAPHPYGSHEAYAVMNGLSTPGEKVYKTTDRGQNWANVTGNLPNVPASDVIAHPTDPNKLYLSSEMGCFRTTDGGTLWHRWNNGMPGANIVTELAFIDSLSTVGRFYVVAGSYGRSIWQREITGDDPVDVDEILASAEAFGLDQNFPNPANAQTAIAFAVPRDGKVDLSVFDVAGRRVKTIISDDLPAGRHEYTLDTSRMAAGVYFYKLQTHGKEQTRKLIIVR
ncbi:MAG: T9SS type A sorting domain-containing protein [Gemmatimonadota bacterium]|jgi:photosystem II stability/assembly factor-like uncharacterized protein|nr:T9SS type A sorting domain-containing protein [Gemmatimonadota bacterium]MDP7031698.1 T9SS type A sorting domain-containing protein [Gemmatimonadota bacterium]